MFIVQITSKAERDIARNTDWWETNRSKEQADRWYVKIYQAMKTLEHMPMRCPIAPETEEFERLYRQLHFGLSSKQTHRILFSVDDETVTIYRVLHMGQEDIVEHDEINALEN